MGSDWTEYGRISDQFQYQKLVDLCVPKIGIQTGPFGSQLHKEDYVDIGTPIITVEHLLENRISHSDIPKVSDEDKERLVKYSLQTGDIVFSRVGSVDRRSLVREEEDGWLFSGRCLRVRAKNSVIDPKYLSYFFGHEGFKNHIRSIAVGATMPSINTKILSDIRVFYPSLPEQKAIAHILGTLDDKIELNRQMNATLEAMAQALFKSWFVDFDPVIDNALAAGNPIPAPLQARAHARKTLTQTLSQGERASTLPSPSGREAGGEGALPAAIQQQFPSRFVFNDDLGWVPEGWEVRSVEDAIEVNPKVDLKKGDIASFVDMKALPTSGYDITEVIKKAYAGGAKFQQGDVLLARITPCLENGKTGIVDFLRDNEAGFGSTEFIVLRGKGELRTAFVACLARYEAFRSHCELGMVGSSGRQRVQNSSFRDFFLALPEAPNLAKEFDRLTSSNFQKMVVNKNEAVSLAGLRDTLLPKLLSGQLRIPAAEKQISEAL